MLVNKPGSLFSNYGGCEWANSVISNLRRNFMRSCTSCYNLKHTFMSDVSYKYNWLLNIRKGNWWKILYTRIWDALDPDRIPTS